MSGTTNKQDDTGNPSTAEVELVGREDAKVGEVEPTGVTLTPEQKNQFLRSMLVLRHFEMTAYNDFLEGRIPGFCHVYSFQLLCLFGDFPGPCCHLERKRYRSDEKSGKTRPRRGQAPSRWRRASDL